MEKARLFSFSPALWGAEELSGDCITAILKPTFQSFPYNYWKGQGHSREHKAHPTLGQAAIHDQSGRAPLHIALDPPGTAMG